MTKSDASRTLQTSILTRHEADKTRSTIRMGCLSWRWDGAPEKKVKGSVRSVIRGIKRADGQTDRNVWVRGIITREVKGEWISKGCG